MVRLGTYLRYGAVVVRIGYSGIKKSTALLVVSAEGLMRGAWENHVPALNNKTSNDHSKGLETMELITGCLLFPPPRLPSESYFPHPKVTILLGRADFLCSMKSLGKLLLVHEVGSRV